MRRPSEPSEDPEIQGLMSDGFLWMPAPSIGIQVHTCTQTASTGGHLWPLETLHSL